MMTENENKRRINEMPSERATESLPATLHDRIHLKMISIVHDSLYKLFVDPNRLLHAAELTRGKIALEVGYGPGFFTIPAAEIVGEDGLLYAVDINPASLNRINHLVKNKELTNVVVMLADAAMTGLPEASIDIAFLFGVLHSLKDLDSVLREIYRVLKEQNGVLSVQRSGWSEKKLLNRFTALGLFRFISKEKRIYKFEKVGSFGV